MSGLQPTRSTHAAGLATSVIFMAALTDPRIPARMQALGERAVLLRSRILGPEFRPTAGIREDMQP